MTIRKPTAADAAQIAKLSIQLGYGASVADTAARIDTINESANDIAFVALDNEMIIGWIHAFYTMRLESRAFCEIGGLVTDEAYRGKGVGRQLVEHIKPWCVSKNVAAIKVRSNVKRSEAHQFYRHVGFNDVKQQSIFELSLQEK